jgi:phage protein U
MMYAQLGNIPFQLIMPTGIDSSQSYNYAEHQVIEGKPLLQYIGDGLETFNIQIRFHFSYCTPGLELQRLRAEAAKHQALPLLFANGTYKGRYVIDGIAVTTELTADDGSLMSVDIKLTLKEWVDSTPLETKKKQQKAKAKARKKKGKPRTKAKKAEIPQLTAASKKAGYAIKTVDGKRVAVRQGKNA